MLSRGLSNELLVGKPWVPATCSCGLISWSVSLCFGVYIPYVLSQFVGIAQWLKPSGAG